MKTKVNKTLSKSLILDLPKFPKAIRLSLNIINNIENYVSNFQGYSDFNHISLFSYDIKNDTQLSKLNNNLVIRLRDYLDGSYVYTFIGKFKPNTTANTVLKHAVFINSSARLCLIPEFVAKKLSSKNFSIKEDADNNDYIYDLDKLSKLAGSIYSSKRRMVNLFNRKYPSNFIKCIDLASKKNHNLIFKLFKLWETKRTKKSEIEKQALIRLINSYSKFNLDCLVQFINKDKPIAFLIGEKSYNKTTTFHFSKYDSSYTGNFENLLSKSASHFKKLGYRYVNLEQDLGIFGIRESKRSWKPVSYLKKYIVELRTMH